MWPGFGSWPDEPKCHTFFESSQGQVSGSRPVLHLKKNSMLSPRATWDPTSPPENPSLLRRWPLPARLPVTSSGGRWGPKVRGRAQLRRNGRRLKITLCLTSPTTPWISLNKESQIWLFGSDRSPVNANLPYHRLLRTISPPSSTLSPYHRLLIEQVSFIYESSEGGDMSCLKAVIWVVWRWWYESSEGGDMSCLKVVIWVIWRWWYESSEGGDMNHPKAVMCHLKVLREQSEISIQNSSYRRSLKYFVLFSHILC